MAVAALTTPKQAPVITSIPDDNMSDSQLQTWAQQNKGKVAYNQFGQQITIPDTTNTGALRAWISNPSGALYGLSQTNPMGSGSSGAAGGGGASGSGSSSGGVSGTGNPGGGSNSYYTGAGQSGGVNSMADNSYYSNTTGQPNVSAQQAIQYYVSQGGNPNIDPNTAMAFFQAQQPNFGKSGVSPQDAISYYIQKGGNPNIDPTTAVAFYEAQHPDELAKGVANAALTPEQRALQQMQQIDPASEALRTSVSQSYQTPLSQAAQGGPNAQQLQTYLDTYKQLDPAGYASMMALGGSEDASLKQATDQLNLGSELDPVTARQVEQQTRLGQAARGNVYGTPQMVKEAMTTGQAGLALQQQRQQAAQAAQGNMQSYLTSGATPGSTALSLYDRNQANLRAAQQGALSYLSSGQTPYQAGAGYLSGAEATAANAAQGGPVYNPVSLGSNYGGTAGQAPQYGLDVGAQAQNYFNSLSNAYGGMGGTAKNRGASAASGAMSGALGGATAGTAIYPGIGTAIGAIGGGILGGTSGYFS